MWGYERRSQKLQNFYTAQKFSIKSIFETELSYCLKCRRKIECKKPRV